MLQCRHDIRTSLWISVCVAAPAVYWVANRNISTVSTAGGQLTQYHCSVAFRAADATAQWYWVSRPPAPVPSRAYSEVKQSRFVDSKIQNRKCQLQARGSIFPTNLKFRRPVLKLWAKRDGQTDGRRQWIGRMIIKSLMQSIVSQICRIKCCLIKWILFKFLKSDL